MNLCIGIDPSINSTGVTCLFIDNGQIVKEFFYVITNGKLTKRQIKAAEDNVHRFRYLMYEKNEVGDADDNHELEEYKTLNMLNIVDELKRIVDEYIAQGYEISICIEGISYGSVKRTRSVFDLAGLNYLVRNAFIRNDNVIFTVATPGEIKKFASGSGNCKKEMMIELFRATHMDFDLPKLDDVADAYWMAIYAKKIMDEINK